MKYTALLIALMISLPAFAKSKDPSVVPTVDLNKYSGVWYQVAHYPSFFSTSCESSSAEYAVIPEGLSVFNQCFKDKKVLTSIKGTATIPNPQFPAKLEVDFGFFRKGDYWIIALDQNYQWAVVSGPERKSLFVLSRTAPMEATLLDSILKNLEADGFDLSKVVIDKYN